MNEHCGLFVWLTVRRQSRLLYSGTPCIIHNTFQIQLFNELSLGKSNARFKQTKLHFSKKLFEY